MGGWRCSSIRTDRHEFDTHGTTPKLAAQQTAVWWISEPYNNRRPNFMGSSPGIEVQYTRERDDHRSCSTTTRRLITSSLAREPCAVLTAVAAVPRAPQAQRCMPASQAVHVRPRRHRSLRGVGGGHGCQQRSGSTSESLHQVPNTAVAVAAAFRLLLPT